MLIDFRTLPSRIAVEFQSLPIGDSQIIPAAGGQDFPDYL